jgi:uncharacterized repeat protein (TIGR01451 family)
MKKLRTLLALMICLSGFTAWSGVLTYTYDDAGRLINVLYSGGTNTTFTYDNNGNLAGTATFSAANPDVAVTQTATPDPAVAGFNISYTVTVYNNSAVTATGVALTNNLPAGVSVTSTRVSQGAVSQSGNTLSWSIGTLTNQAVALLNVTVRSTAAGVLINSATVSLAQADPDPANNLSTLATTVIPPPLVESSLVNGTLLLTWPAFEPTFSLEFTDDLTPPISWTLLTSPIGISGDQFRLLEPLATNRFYRLASPP